MLARLQVVCAAKNGAPRREVALHNIATDYQRRIN
jgi:hypothetical protein